MRTWMKDGDLYVLAVNAQDALQKATLKIASGSWDAVKCEVGTEGRMAAPDTLELELPPLGMSFMRLKAAK